MTLTFVEQLNSLMEWDEIDFENNLWRIPAEKMKMALPHIVPLSRQAIELLEVVKPITGISNTFSITTVQLSQLAVMRFAPFVLWAITVK
jgi:integrase